MIVAQPKNPGLSAPATPAVMVIEWVSPGGVTSAVTRN
jgi:hypothetical protein